MMDSSTPTSYAEAAFLGLPSTRWEAVSALTGAPLEYVVKYMSALKDNKEECLLVDATRGAEFASFVGALAHIGTRLDAAAASIESEMGRLLWNELHLKRHLDVSPKRKLMCLTGTRSSHNSSKEDIVEKGFTMLRVDDLDMETANSNLAIDNEDDIPEQMDPVVLDMLEVDEKANDCIFIVRKKLEHKHFDVSRRPMHMMKASVCDVSLKYKLEEDVLYANDERLQFVLRRGCSLLECTCYFTIPKSLGYDESSSFRDKKKLTYYYILRRGLPKFFDLDILLLTQCPYLQEENVDTFSEVDYAPRHLMTAHTQMGRRISEAFKQNFSIMLYVLRKANGENVQISYSGVLNSWIICSKNVCTVTNDKGEHLLEGARVEEKRYQYSKLIAEWWHMNLARYESEEKVESLKAFLSCNTIIGEMVGLSERQSIIKQQPYYGLVWYAIVPNSGLFQCLPPNRSFSIFDKFSLPHVEVFGTYMCRSIEELALTLYEIKEEVLSTPMHSIGEGVVCYLVADGEQNDYVLGITKIKSVEYVLARRIREKLKAVIPRITNLGKRWRALKEEVVGKREMDDVVSQYYREGIGMLENIDLMKRVVKKNDSGIENGYISKRENSNNIEIVCKQRVDEYTELYRACVEFILYGYTEREASIRRKVDMRFQEFCNEVMTYRETRMRSLDTEFGLPSDEVLDNTRNMQSPQDVCNTGTGSKDNSINMKNIDKQKLNGMKTGRVKVSSTVYSGPELVIYLVAPPLTVDHVVISDILDCPKVKRKCGDKYRPAYKVLEGEKEINGFPTWTNEVVSICWCYLPKKLETLYYKGKLTHLDWQNTRSAYTTVNAIVVIWGYNSSGIEACMSRGSMVLHDLTKQSTQDVTSLYDLESERWPSFPTRCRTTESEDDSVMEPTISGSTICQTLGRCTSHQCNLGRNDTKRPARIITFVKGEVTPHINYESFTPILVAPKLNSLQCVWLTEEARRFLSNASKWKLLLEKWSQLAAALPSVLPIYHKYLSDVASKYPIKRDKSEVLNARGSRQDKGVNQVVDMVTKLVGPPIINLLVAFPIGIPGCGKSSSLCTLLSRYCQLSREDIANLTEYTIWDCPPNEYLADSIHFISSDNLLEQELKMMGYDTSKANICKAVFRSASKAGLNKMVESIRKHIDELARVERGMTKRKNKTQEYNPKHYRALILLDKNHPPNAIGPLVRRTFESLRGVRELNNISYAFPGKEDCKDFIGEYLDRADVMVRLHFCALNFARPIVNLDMSWPYPYDIEDIEECLLRTLKRKHPIMSSPIECVNIVLSFLKLFKNYMNYKELQISHGVKYRVDVPLMESPNVDGVHTRAPPSITQKILRRYIRDVLPYIQPFEDIESTQSAFDGIVEICESMEKCSKEVEETSISKIANIIREGIDYSFQDIEDCHYRENGWTNAKKYQVMRGMSTEKPQLIGVLLSVSSITKLELLCRSMFVDCNNKKYIPVSDTLELAQQLHITTFYLGKHTIKPQQNTNKCVTPPCVALSASKIYYSYNFMITHIIYVERMIILAALRPLDPLEYVTSSSTSYKNTALPIDNDIYPHVTIMKEYRIKPGIANEVLHQLSTTCKELKLFKTASSKQTSEDTTEDEIIFQKKETKFNKYEIQLFDKTCTVVVWSLSDEKSKDNIIYGMLNMLQ